MIINKGLKRSAEEVIIGIKKLLGSFPLRKTKIDPMNKIKNKLPNRRKTVANKIKMIIKGLTMLIPIISAIK